MNKIKKYMEVGGDQRAKREDPKKIAYCIPTVCCGALPWLITYGVFYMKQMDPEHCWVAEGSFAAYPER